MNKALDAFDKCPNRVTGEVGRGDYAWTTVTCPKYPQGIDFLGENEFHSTHFRNRAALKIGCLGCRYSSVEYDVVKERDLIDRLNPLIVENCGELFLSGHYSEATINGYKTVRDRFRELTRFEKGSDAFGKGKLYINGSVAEHVDDDRQKGVLHLAIANDCFRNVGAHTSSRLVSDSINAYEHLAGCSLLLNYLEDTKIKED
jgi:uncharacterized protein (TIGR02391 family)